jgi:hypothetical protein
LRRLARDGAFLLALTAPLLVAGLVPVVGPMRIELPLGPGDEPYVTGFSKYSEIENAVGLHWAGPRARMAVPLEARGALRVGLRFARVLPQAADVVLTFGAAPVGHLVCRGGAVVEPSLGVAASGWTPLAIEALSSSADSQGRALRFDWVRFDLAAGARARLRGAALWRPALLVVILFGLLRLAGIGSGGSVALCLPWCALGLTLLRLDPWLLHRFLTWLPETLALLGLALVGAGRLLERRQWLLPGDTRLVAAAATAAFVLRGAALNHPDYWYPDLHSHSRLVEIVRDAGLDFFRQPAHFIWEQGVWLKRAYGKPYAMPYSPAFHLPFALLPIDRENVVTFMKLGAAALSTLPLLAVAVLARQFGAAPAGVAVLALIPAYGIRLSFAFVAAIFGHAVDCIALVWLARRLRRLGEPRTFLAGVLLVTASSLAYVSSVVVLPVFLALLALLLALEARDDRWRLALAVLGIGAGGALLAFAIYYRGFSELIFEMLGRIASGTTQNSAREVHGLWEVLSGRSLVFFGPLVPLLALAGLGRLLRPRENRTFLAAWALAYVVLLLGRARYPDVFGHTHDVLFAAPLICLAAGDSLARLYRLGGLARPLAALTWIAIGVLGLRTQWEVFAQQFGYAR